jgi:DNA-binding GntR family transcriptional regulator
MGLDGGAAVSRSAGTRAYAIIKEGILSGRFAPNERLKEDELTTLCQVSRTPVREALRRLGIEGLVKVTPNAGAQVIAPDPAELGEIYQLRGMIEGHAAERAAANITPDDIGRLKDLATEMERAVEIGGADLGPRFTPANAEFHKIILTAAMSPRLSAMAALVIELPLTLRTLHRYSEGDRHRSLRHHRELIDALEMRDGPWAASVMRSHVHAAYRALVRGADAGETASDDR